MGYVERHGITFHNKIVNGYVVKFGLPETDSNLGFVMQFDDSDLLTKIAHNLQLAIVGDFDKIIDTDISCEESLAYITPTCVEFYNLDYRDWQTITFAGTEPLQDIYDVTIAWRDFLLQPPFQGPSAGGI